MNVGDIVWFKDKDGFIYCSQLLQEVIPFGKYIQCTFLPIIGNIEWAETNLDSVGSYFYKYRDNCKFLHFNKLDYSLNFEDLTNGQCDNMV